MAGDFNLRFNWRFLVNLLISAILVLFLLFFFNRAFGKVIFYIIRRYTWYRYRTHINVQALQISLLGGRIFFQGLRYYGDNQIIKISAGHITWRYWLRKVRDIDLQRYNIAPEENGDILHDSNQATHAHHLDQSEKAGVEKKSDDSCRISVSLQGFEWFVFNRGPAYDYIVEEVNRHAAKTSNGRNTDSENHGQDTGYSSRSPVSQLGEKTAPLDGLLSSLQPQTIQRIVSYFIPQANRSKPDVNHSSSRRQSYDSEASSDASVNELDSSSQNTIPILLRFLPVHLECSRGGIIVGNEKTKGLLVVEFAKAKGEVDAGSSQPDDQYRQLFNLNFLKPKVSMKCNPDYKEIQSTSATPFSYPKEAAGDHQQSHWLTRLLRRKKDFFRSAWLGRFPAFTRRREDLSSSSHNEFDSNASKKPRSSSPDQWTGLTRYLEDSDQAQSDLWAQIEYAERELLLDSPSARISFYWDEPGTVQPFAMMPGDNINGSSAPKWGLDIALKGGVISYGPWADQLRANLQAAFFPALRQTSVPATALQPGQKRQVTQFEVFVDLEDTTTLHIPTREPSKDWKWKGQSHIESKEHQGIRLRHKKASRSTKFKRKTVISSESRSPGWFDVRVSKDSTIHYTMDMMASQRGWQNKLDLDLKSLEVSSSVNHGLLTRSTSAAVNCDLSNPLKWNDLHQWHFNVHSSDLELFLLRDHIFLITDLVSDWTTGPLSHYYTFVPFVYSLALDLSDFKLHLNINDSNIINKPADFDDNFFFTIHGTGLKADVKIPMKSYRPNQNEISFDVAAHTGGLDLLTPLWSTYSTFLDSNHVALLNNLTVSGKYNYFTRNAANLTDTLLLEIHGATLALDLHGFLIKYFLRLKDNYFGDDLHFKTYEEYQSQLADPLKSGSKMPAEELNHHKSNDLDVILLANASNSALMLPTKLYTSREHVRIDIAEVAIELRFTSYFMDFNLDCSPFTISTGEGGDGVMTPESVLSNAQIFVNGVNLYGHRLFGLPPTEPTYMCNWDIDVGTTSGEVYPDFLRKVVLAAQTFAFCFEDVENSMGLQTSAAEFDVTYLNAHIQPVKLWIRLDEFAFLFQIDQVDFQFNDLAGTHLSDRLKLRIPSIAIGCVDGEAASRHKHRKQITVDTFALLVASFDIGVSRRKPSFSKFSNQQLSHMIREDQRTKRIPFIIDQAFQRTHHHADEPGALPPAIAFPPIPAPIKHRHPVPTNFLPNEREDLINSSSSNRSFRATKKTFVSTKSKATHGSLAESFQSDPRLEVSDFQSRSGSTDRGSLEITGRETFASDHLPQQRNTSSRLKPSFSSTFAAPYFPLLKVEPDLTSLPPPFPVGQDGLKHKSNLAFHEVAVSDENSKNAYSNLNICLDQGLRAFLMPVAVSALTLLLSQLQPSSASELVDKFQAETATSVLKGAEPESKISQTADTFLYIPFVRLRFLNADPTIATERQNLMKDDYNLDITDIRLVFRSREIEPVHHRHVNKIHPGLFGRVDFHQLLLSAREVSSDNCVGPTVIGLSMEQPAVQMSQREKINSAKIRCNNLSVTAEPDKIPVLLRMVDRLACSYKISVGAFDQLEDSQRRKSEILIATIVSPDSQLSDPHFLTRPSFISRSRPKHLRGNSSWKTMMRFRYSFQNLPPEEKRELNLAFASYDNPPPPDVTEKCQKAIDFLKSPSLNSTELAGVLSNQVGYPAVDSSFSGEEPSFEIGLDVTKLCLQTEPRAHPNEILVTGISTTVVYPFHERNAPDESQSENRVQPRTLLLETHSHMISVRLNWELCKMVEDISEALSSPKADMKPDKVEYSRESHPRKKTSISDSINFRSVIAVDSCVLTIECVNVKAMFAAKKLATVATYQSDSATEVREIALLLESQASNHELRAHSEVLVFYELQRPSLSFSVKLAKENASPLSVASIAASSQSCRYEIKREIAVILEVLELLVRDELRQLVNVFNRISAVSKSSASSSHESKPPARFPTVQVQAALFLHSYKLCFEVLPSLSYVISGNTARISCAPIANKGHILDYDLKSHSHEIKSFSTGKSQSISLHRMPPINGRVAYRNSSSEDYFQILSSVESIKLDAAAVNSLINAIHRPQVAKTIESIQREIQTLSRTFSEVLQPNDKTTSIPKSKPSKPSNVKSIVYDVRLTFVGLGIHATASKLLPENDAAELNLTCGLIRLKATNKRKKSKSILRYPDVRLGLQQISFELARANAKTRQSCGQLSFEAHVLCTSKHNEAGNVVRAYHVRSGFLQVNLFADTASTIVDVIGNLQERIKDFDLSKEVKYLQKFGQRTLRQPSRADSINGSHGATDQSTPQQLFGSVYSLEVNNVQICWLIGESFLLSPGHQVEDLVLSFAKIGLATKKQNSAQLVIGDLQLQLLPRSESKDVRSSNSALLPEVIFNVAYLSTEDDRKLAFQAAGKSLDLRITSDSILPVNDIAKSIASAAENFRQASANWSSLYSKTESPRQNVLGTKKLKSLLVDADFAGAVVHFEGKLQRQEEQGAFQAIRGTRTQHGRYGQFVSDKSNARTVLRAPGIAFKVEYKDNGDYDPTLNAEIKVDASTNILFPSVVPLVMEMSSSIKEIVNDSNNAERARKTKPASHAFLEEDGTLKVDPDAIWGRSKLNIGLRICRQEFSLSCQPYARVAAMAKFDDIYITVNTVNSADLGTFFALSATISKLQVSVQHDYSRESTASFGVDSVVLSLMNSRHVSGVSGLSAILNISPMNARLNCKQLQDFLLFREMWFPAEIRHASRPSAEELNIEPQTYLVQKYQQVAATAAFPWNATVAIAEIEVMTDLGPSLGKVAFKIADFWISSKKTSNWEQNLCVSFNETIIESNGRLSGFVELRNTKARTSIRWPARREALAETPLIQASLSFEGFRSKISFDYQSFFVADVASFEFLMYNVRDKLKTRSDRLVGTVDCDKVQIFVTTGISSQGLALYQAASRLVQEKRAAFETALKDLEKFLHRKSVVPGYILQTHSQEPSKQSENTVGRKPVLLHTDVVVTVKTVSLGAYPSTFFDRQILKLEALNSQARFAVRMEQGKLHSGLALTLGEFRVGLAQIKRPNVPKSLADVVVEDVIAESTAAKGGIILRVPRVIASMQTWQKINSNQIDYIFKSLFEGKVDVGWNYARISFIRGMWDTHSKALAQRLGKPLPQSAVQITGGPMPTSKTDDLEEGKVQEGAQEKITAVVNVPQSKYEYKALEPPIIETPQLRDMGEATPPLEWIGLHRDRLPNVTHQIVIVSLLEVAKEVEDAYSKILGTS